MLVVRFKICMSRSINVLSLLHFGFGLMCVSVCVFCVFYCCYECVSLPSQQSPRLQKFSVELIKCEIICELFSSSWDAVCCFIVCRVTQSSLCHLESTIPMTTNCLISPKFVIVTGVDVHERTPD